MDVGVDLARRRRPRSARCRRRRCSRRACPRERLRSSSRRTPSPGPSASTVSSTFFAKARNSSLFETGSVSLPTATIVPACRRRRSGSRPCPPASRGRRAWRPGGAPLAQELGRPFSMSPSVSLSARLQSIIPAPVWSRSSLTSEAEMLRSLRRLHGLFLLAELLVLGRLLCRLGVSGLRRLLLRLRRLRCRLGRLRCRRGRCLRRARARRRGWKSAGEALFIPSSIASTIARVISSHERIASSLPGIGKSASSGSQFVSTSATTGRPSRRASRTASCSLRRSMMKTASGCFFMSATPPRLASSFSSSDSIVIRSFAGSSSSWPPPSAGGDRAGARSAPRSCASSSAGRPASAG